MQNKITILITSYYSFKHLKRIVKYLKNYKFCIIENSLDNKVKKYFYKYKNVKVIIPKKNLGYGAGNNLGISKIKTKFVLILNPDTIFTKKNYQKLLEYINKIKNFGILLPRLKNKISIKFFLKKNVSFFEIYEQSIGMSIASGCCMLINKDKFSNNKIFDEKFFLYKEETDLLKRCKKNNIKCYILKNSLVTHMGSSSSKENLYNKEIKLLRDWHWMWSNFYYYKKHYGFTYAFFKFFRSLISSFLKKNFFWFGKSYRLKYQYRFEGLISSILNKNSFKRFHLNI